MSRARPSRPAAALLTALLSLGLGACGGGGGPTEAPCSAPSDCPGVGLCLVTTCDAGRCGIEPQPAGAPLADDHPGDCQRLACDGHGATVHLADDADLPGDGNACTEDACVAGVPRHAPVDLGTACAQDGGTACDGQGRCLQCLTVAACPGVDTECATRTCSPAGLCGVTYAPEGTPLAAQVGGDCLEAVCGPVGTTTNRPLDGDLPPSVGPCLADLCVAGEVAHPPVPAGTACSGPNGGVQCDGAGACVQCLSAADCPGVDGACAQRTCGAGQCGTDYAADGALSSDPAAGDCSAILCDGVGGSAGRPYPLDLPVDGNPCTQDLCSPEGVPSNPPQPAGATCAVGGGKVCDGAGGCVECNVGADCNSKVCAAHACQAPTCVDGVRNGVETGVDCGGGSCQACGTGQPCVFGGDCLSSICTQQRCAAPSCFDRVRNGAESDVDCGGGSCSGCAAGKACLVDADCASGTCAAGACGAPRVLTTTPAEGAADVPPGTAITLFLSASATTASVTLQAAAGPCSGSVQLSADDFASCLGLSGKVLGNAPPAVTIQPALPLGGPGHYRLRVTGALATSSQGAFQPYDGVAGFTVADAGGCGGALVVSQVYPGGGLAGASWASDFVELHNRSASTVGLGSLSLQTAGGASTASWTVTPLAGSMPPGGYLLVRLAGAGLAGAPLPAPDVTGTAALDPVGGKVVLASTTAPLLQACPVIGVLDLVGYGTSSGAPVACFEGPGVAPAPAPADAGAALVRAGAGCADGNGSLADFAAQLAVPRSAASAAAACGCSGSAVNETGATVEMDWCSLWWPASLTAAQGTPSGTVWGRVYEAGVTDLPGAPVDGFGNPLLVAQLGFGPAGTDPRYATGWSFVAASYNASPDPLMPATEDEYQASFTAPAPGSYAYVFRFSPDGQRWTYCDPDGAGSGGGFAFEPGTLPPLTVTP